jgi:hypothetical protein
MSDYNTEPEIEADIIVTTMSEKQIVNLIIDIDSTIGDLAFTQYLLKKLIESLGSDMSKDEAKTFVTKILNDE